MRPGLWEVCGTAVAWPTGCGGAGRGEGEWQASGLDSICMRIKDLAGRLGWGGEADGGALGAVRDTRSRSSQSAGG